MIVPMPNGPEREQGRDALLGELSAEYGEDWREHFKPGSFGCHELLDRTSLAAEMVERQILEHPSCLQNAEWYALAERAVAALSELYQRVGAEHSADGRDV
jgi:hypothetical protein